MYEIMGTHYDKMKDNIGLNEILENNDSDRETEQAFTMLRPRSPYKLKELI